MWHKELKSFFNPVFMFLLWVLQNPYLWKISLGKS